MGKSIKRDFLYLSITTIIIAMVLLSGFWIFFDYKMFKTDSEQLRRKYMTEYKDLLRNEVDHIVRIIDYQIASTEQRLKTSLQERTSQAYAITTNIIKQNNNILDDTTLRKLVKDSLRNIRFHDDHGYYFAFNVQGTIELSPPHPELEGHPLQTTFSNRDQLVLEDALQLAQSAGEGFYNYDWTNPNQPDIRHPKLAYIKYVPELDWVIGTGESLEDFTQDLQQEMSALIEKVRFGKDKENYLFAATWNGIGTTFPATGKNMLETQDVNGRYIVKELIEKAKTGGGFVQYVMPEMHNIQSSPKLSYAAPIPEWQWYIGAGVYIDEIDTIIAHNQQVFKDKVMAHLKILALVLSCLLLINFCIVYFISHNIWKQIDLFSHFFRRASTEAISINIEHLTYNEFREIGNLANVMLEQRNDFLQEISISRDEWANTFNAICDCVLLFDANGNVVQANAEALKLHKMSSEEIVGRHFSTICSPNNPTRQTLIDNLPHSVELDNKALKTTFLAMSFPIFSKEGKLHRVILIAHDITERKQLLEQLAQSQKMEVIGLLAGGVAHDLNNILSGIVGYPDIILPQLPKESPIRKQIMAIQKSGQQAADIVADLLTLARGITASKKVIDLNTLIIENLHSPESAMIKKMYPRVSISTDLDAALLHCCCSPVHIKKSLLNLTMNAAEAIEDHGLITISTRNRFLEAGKAAELQINSGKYVIIKVEDNGPGISTTDLERIFEPFYTKKVMGNSGSGLGLSIVWNSVKDHQGAIEVTSNSSEGTKFSLYLPATEDKILQDSHKLNLQGNGESLLIVDDDSQQQDIATHFSKMLGYNVKAVESGERALAYLAENQTDVILLDMLLGSGMNGRETYEKIIEMYPKQKALILSGYSQDSEVHGAQLLGAGQYVKKPYTINQLGLALQNILRNPKNDNAKGKSS